MAYVYHVPSRSLMARHSHHEQYQQQIPGNLYAVQAFLDTMANTTIDGKPAVTATVLAFWQGFAEMTKTLGMFTGGYFANRFGRK